MRISINKSAATQRFIGIKLPSITGATRLETQPTAINMKEGLKAPLADPLWMLARQWQFNEFQGEDAGTPLRIQFSIDGQKVDAFRAGADPAAPWQAIDATSAPIETRVEAEPAWAVHARLRGEAGLHALRMASAATKAALLAAYPLALPAPTDPASDQAGLLWSTVFDRRTLDAALLAADLKPLVDATGTLTALPAALVLDAGEVEPARAMLQRWYAYQSTLAYEGDPAQSSWQRDRMEYAFALKAGGVALRSDEYTDGHVDWDDFRAGPAQQPTEAISEIFAVASRHPSPVRYPGMPAERYWEFEDGNVNFAGAEAGVTDLLRMSVTEFALTFGNDWFRRAGATARRLGAISVSAIRRDHGQFRRGHALQRHHAIRSMRRNVTQLVHLLLDGQSGRCKGRLQHDHVSARQSRRRAGRRGARTKRCLARDEMANLAWAIEQHGARHVGRTARSRTSKREAPRVPAEASLFKDGGIESPQLVYRLQTPVPANWTPLLPDA